MGTFIVGFQLATKTLFCLMMLLSAAAVTSGQEETSQDEGQESAEEQKRQRQEMASEEDVDVTRPEEKAEEREDVVEFYGSLRVVGGMDGDTVRARDNASRFGLYAAKDFAPRYGLFARLELGVNIVDAFDRFLNPKANAPDGAGYVLSLIHI